MHPTSRSLCHIAKSLFWLDTRSLGLFRIGLGLILLASLLTVAPQFSALFTEDGAFPQKIILGNNRAIGGWNFLSLYYASDLTPWAYFLYASTILLTILFTAGLYTRWITFPLFLLTLSHVGRNGYMTFGYDRVVTVALFWAAFVPLDRHFSLTSRMRPPPPNESRDTIIASLGTVAFVSQIMMLYLHAAFAKYGFQWLEGRAVQVVLSNTMYTTPLGHAIKGYDWLTIPMTYSTLIVEVFAPLLLIVPWRSTTPRLLGAGSLIIMHIFMALTMDLAWFPWVCSVFILASMPFEAICTTAAFAQNLTPRALHKQLRKVFLALDAALTTLATTLHRNNQKLALYARQSALACALCGALLLFTGSMIRTHAWLPAWFDQAVSGIGLAQDWGFFGPNPRSLDRMIVIQGTFKDGSIWALNLDGKEVLDLERRPGSYGMTVRVRDRNWREDVFENDNPLSRHLSSYLCNKYKGDEIANEPKLIKIDVLDLQQRTDKDGKMLSENPRLIWYWNCA